MKKVLFVGIDVDDKQYQCASICQLSNDIRDFTCSPNAKSLINALKKLRDSGAVLKICYEATYLGFSLFRELKKSDFDCVIAAPSLIPQIPGKKQKTNRLDARKLADFYMKGLLTFVHVPDEAQEKDRDLIRSRKFLVNQLSGLKNHIANLCRRMNWDYKTECNKISYWTADHVKWLKNKNKECTNQSLKINLTILIRQLEQTKENISFYDTEVENLAEKEIYKKKVKALNCLRGFDTTTSMTIVTELGDINRFDHPRRLTSYVGFDLIEYSSGDKEKKYKMSKDGNPHLRTTIIEACQFAIKPPTISNQLKRKRQGADKKIVDIADRCMKRLHSKGQRLLYKGKQRNKIKGACAREMLGFIWEILKAA